MKNACGELFTIRRGWQMNTARVRVTRSLGRRASPRTLLHWFSHPLPHSARNAPALHTRAHVLGPTISLKDHIGSSCPSAALRPHKVHLSNARVRLPRWQTRLLSHRPMMKGSKLLYGLSSVRAALRHPSSACQAPTAYVPTSVTIGILANHYSRRRKS